MNAGAWILLAMAAAVAVYDWSTVVQRDERREAIAKPATLALLVIAALVLDPADEAMRTWFVAALVLSLIGDVLLLPSVDRFVAGLVAFLFGHVAYCAGFLAGGVSFGRLALGIGLVVLAMAFVGGPIVLAARSGEHHRMALPVGVYMLVISSMVALAIGSENGLATAGAVSFYGSDAMIGWDRFRRKFGWSRIGIMVTYHVGQGLLVASLV